MIRLKAEHCLIAIVFVASSLADNATEPEESRERATTRNGLFSDPVKACLKNMNNKEFPNITLEECKEKCFSATSFKCRSLDYDTLYKNDRSRCYLSEDSKKTQPGAYSEPCYHPMCSDRSDCFYLEQIFPELWTAAVWLNDDSTQTVTNIDEEAFNEHFAACPVIRYTRNGAVHSVYMRTSPIPSSFNAFSQFTNNWSSANNELNTDFRLYDNLEDALVDEGAWTFCNYDDGTGYPRDCGKERRRNYHWFRMPDRGKSLGITAGIGFDIYSGSMCPSSFGTNETSTGTSNIIEAKTNAATTTETNETSAETSTTTEATTTTTTTGGGADFVCKTISGNYAGLACKFPFKYGDGKTYNGCTNLNHTHYWCSTRIDPQGVHVGGRWGNCDDSCPKHTGTNETFAETSNTIEAKTNAASTTETNETSAETSNTIEAKTNAATTTETNETFAETSNTIEAKTNAASTTETNETSAETSNTIEAKTNAATTTGTNETSSETSNTIEAKRNAATTTETNETSAETSNTTEATTTTRTTTGCDASSQLIATILNGTMDTFDNVKLLPDEGYLPIELDFTKLKDDDFNKLARHHTNLNLKVMLGGYSLFDHLEGSYCTKQKGRVCSKYIIPLPTRFQVNLIIPVKADFDGYSCSYKGLVVGVDERLIYKKWTKWSKCSVECGNGTKTRSRDCILDQEEYCKNISDIRQEKPCDDVKPCQGNYTQWGEWGVCDKDCVNSTNIPGKKQRSRTCEGGDCGGLGLTESKDCWGSPEPNFCVPNCSVVAMEQTKSKIRKTRYDLTVKMKRPPQGTWDNMFSQELLVRDEEYFSDKKIWILNETIYNKQNEHKSIKKNVNPSETSFQCSPCAQNDQTCNCTLTNMKLLQNYSLRLLVKEKSSSHQGISETIILTKCPKQIIMVDNWQCNSGNQLILANGVCNGTPDCGDSSDEDESMCKGESKFKYVGYPLLFCLIFDIVLVGLLFHINQIEKRKLQTGVKQSSQLEELWQHVWKTNQTNGEEIGKVIENLSENEKVKALDISTALEHTLQELVFNSFVSILGESKMLEQVATKIMNKKKRKAIIDVVKPGCIGRLKLKFLGMFSSSVITFAMFAMALVGGIFSSINSVYDPFKDITLILVFHFFKEEIIQENFSRIDGLNLTVVVRILIGCLVVSYVVLTWVRVKKLPTEIMNISIGTKICCIIPGFFYVLNTFISISISHELYQAQRRLEKLKGKEKMKEIALISHLEDKIYLIEDKKRSTASVKAVLEQMIQSSICSTLFLRTNLRAIFLSTITKTIPYLLEVMTIVSFLTLLLKIHAYKSGCKQSFFSLGGLLQTSAMCMMLIQKVLLYILLGHQFPVLIVAILVLMVTVIFVGNHLLGHHLFLKIGFPDRFIYAVASSLIPITLPEPLEVSFREEKSNSKPKKQGRNRDANPQSNVNAL